MQLLKYIIIGMMYLFPILILLLIYDIFGIMGAYRVLVWGFFILLYFHIKKLKGMIKELNDKVDSLKESKIN